MTTQEAINVLEKYKIVPKSEVVKEAYTMAISALEKQMPKKPRVDDDGWFYCPKCDETFSLTDILNRHNKFCGNCGQALDWGDTECPIEIG